MIRRVRPEIHASLEDLSALLTQVLRLVQR